MQEQIEEMESGGVGFTGNRKYLRQIQEIPPSPYFTWLVEFNEQRREGSLFHCPV